MPRTQPSAELQPPDTLSVTENNRDLLQMKEDKMPPKMRKRWMHREVQAMKGIGLSDQEREKDWLVGLGIRLEVTNRLGRALLFIRGFLWTHAYICFR